MDRSRKIANDMSLPMHSEYGDSVLAETIQVGPEPILVTCPHCRIRNKTTIRYKSTSKTHIACLLLAWTMCCCFFPYCVNSCRNANHYCSMCNTFVGTYRS